MAEAFRPGTYSPAHQGLPAWRLKASKDMTLEFI